MCGDLCVFVLVELTYQHSTKHNAHHFECPAACMHLIERRQHASQLCNGLGQSSCEETANDVGYWRRTRVPCACQLAVSVKSVIGHQPLL